MPLSHKNIAMILYTIAVVCNVFEIILMKHLGVSYDLSVESLIFSRTIFECIIILPVVFYKKIFSEFLLCNQKRNILIAGILLTCESFLWNSGVRNVSINDAFNVSFLIPIMVTLMSILFLKEKVSKKEILLIFFCIIISVIYVNYQYKSTVNSDIKSYIYLILATIFSSFGLILKKKISFTVSPIVVVSCNVLIFFIIFSGVNIVSVNGVLNSFNFKGNLFMIVNSVLHLIEIYVVIKAYSMINIATLQPLRFNKFLFSATLGYFYFKESLTVVQLIFFVLIAAANLCNSYKFQNKKLEKYI
jgi:drug/metabolite transporter (DMT)-like permease